jgi:hypothetical protein
MWYPPSVTTAENAQKYDVVWPLGARIPDLTTLPDRLADLDGAVVAELWDYAYRGDEVYPIVREELQRRYDGITFVEFPEFGNIHGGGDAKVLARMPDILRERGVDAVLVGVGHCGSCTPAVIRAAIAAERAGVPTVSIVGELFEPLAVHTSRFLGVDGAPLAIYPGRIMMDDEATLRDKVTTTITDQIVAGLTTGTPEIALDTTSPQARDIVFTGTIDEVNDHFYDQLWTDGLPIMPPTVERIEQFLEHTDRDPSEVLGVLRPEGRAATVWNVAVNGVMAGCRPEYLPVLLAIVEAIADPEFRLEDGGSGPGWEPLITVCGPIIGELGLNSGTGVLRVGRRANTTLGRFLRLYTRNIAGLRIPPGDGDNGAIGMSFWVALAEDEAVVRELGWPTFGDDCGVPVGESAVSVQSITAASPQYGEHAGPSNEVSTYLKPLVEFYGKGMLGSWVWVGLAWGKWHPLIVISQHCARVLAANGWTKDDVREHLFREARVPARYTLETGTHYVNLDLKRKVRKGHLPTDFDTDDPEQLIPVFLRPELTRIVVAGNPNMYYQRGFMSHVAGAPVTKIIQRAPAAVASGRDKRG